LERHGVLTREAVAAEGIAGGFSAVYEVLRAMEDAGRVRRGYFVAGLGAAQFALPGADDRLRACREPSPTDEARTLVLAATDPASPYGAAAPWPESPAAARPQRAAGALVVLRDGRLLAWVGRTERSLLTFLPDAEPARAEAIHAIAEALAGLVDEGRRRSVLLATADGSPVAGSPLAEALREVGFTESLHGFLKRAVTPGESGWRARPPRGAAPDWLRRAAGATRDGAAWVPPPGLRAHEGGEELDDDDDGGEDLGDAEPESDEEPGVRRDPRNGDRS
jgi:ATP-dependent Lhr-like helicase